MPEQTTVSVYITRKVNLGNYESVDFNFSINNVEVGASDEEIEEALATGDKAMRHVAAHMRKKLQDAEGSAGNLG